jgi:bifunctional ADP-heptose synthase (sugar kinase/adenylyltransferase)
MSTLKTGKVKTTTIADELDTESTAVTNVINGSAKAWVNFDGTGTVAIRESFNVTSITDNGTGDYTVNFTTAMTDANYSMAGTCTYTITGAAMVLGYYGTNPTVSAARVQVWNQPNNLKYDAVFCQIAFFR